MSFLWREGYIRCAPGGGRKCPPCAGSFLENGPALRAFHVVFVDIRTAVRACERGRLARLLARWRSGLLGLRLRFRDFRLGAEHPGPLRSRPDRVPPHEQDYVVERK